MSDLKLQQVLEKFKTRLSYKELDKTALDISRALSAGSLGNDKDYATWASISNDPLVVVNFVKTYITTLVDKLSSAPFTPEDEDLANKGLSLRLDSHFTSLYQDVLNDGYSFFGVGVKDGNPTVKPVDARYILFNGEDPTLRDSTDIALFEVLPKPFGEVVTPGMDFLAAYVEYDRQSEWVRVSHYHRDPSKGVVTLDIYGKDPTKPEHYKLPDTLDRIPIVRFVGDKVELSDKRYHYRGIYFTMGSVLKALSLSGTKIQIRTASSDDDNYIVDSSAIDNHKETWRNSGAKEVDTVNSNGMDVKPVEFITHDNQFLLDSFNNWKNVISDMLGPVVASGSEAVTREEVIARNEVRDAISNTYLSRIADSIEEVYRCIKMLTGGDSGEVEVFGGYIQSIKKKKDLEELTALYNFAKESGVNTQGFVVQMLAATDLPSDTKKALAVSFQQDPFKSPQVLQLQAQVQQLTATIQQKDQSIALLRMQATQRLERQKEFIDSTERTKRLEIALKQWEAEQKQTQEANMAVLTDCLNKGDYQGALALVEQIRQTSQPLLTDQIINLATNAFAAENAQSVVSALEQSGALGSPPQTTPQEANVNGKPPRTAATLFNDY